MRRHVGLVTIISRVPQKIHIPSKHGDVLRRRNNPSHGIDVILRADVHVPKRPWRQSGHRVVIVRHSEIAALVLVGDVVAQRRWGDAWCAVGVEIGVGARFPNLGGGHVGDGAT